MRAPCAALVHNCPVHVSTLANALADDELLLRVIVAASARNQQRLNRLRRTQGQRQQQERKNSFFHGQFSCLKYRKRLPANVNKSRKPALF